MQKIFIVLLHGKVTLITVEHHEQHQGIFVASAGWWENATDSIRAIRDNIANSPPNDAVYRIISRDLAS